VSFEFDKPSEKGTNRSLAVTECRTCHGDRFVNVRLRSPRQSFWMAKKGFAPSRDSFHEEVAGCPDCNPIHDIDGYFPGGKKFRVMDPAAVRQAMTE
jgi:hypothetical protein